jgi:two-component system, OmpR family, sensor histidine kinase CpxA
MMQNFKDILRARVPVRRLFAKVFLWFWSTILALCAFFIGSRILGTQVVPQTEVMAALASRVADEAAHAYETGGPRGFTLFEQSLLGHSDVQLYLIDSDSTDVLSRPIPSESLAIVQAARNDGRLIERYGLRSRSASYRVRGPSGRPYVLLMNIPLRFGKLVDADLGSGVLFISGVLVVVTLFCLWLVYHIVAPIQGIQSAARRVANGDLNVRAPVEISKRHDELASLALDFDAMVERTSLLVRSQRDLLSSVSHELRSPLARFNMSLGLLRNQSSPESAELLQRMERDVERIDILLGQLLTFSRLESGLSSSQKERVDVSQLVHEVVADGEFEARGYGKSVSIDADNDLCLDKADPQTLRSAFENIIRNAIRFTPPNTAVQVVLRSDKGHASPQVVLSVRDFGPGVPEESLQRIFQPFFRLNPTSGFLKRNGGTGLGLAIALEAIRLHGGTILARNANPTGLEIRITLPINSAQH